MQNHKTVGKEKKEPGRWPNGWQAQRWVAGKPVYEKDMKQDELKSGLERNHTKKTSNAGYD